MKAIKHFLPLLILVLGSQMQSVMAQSADADVTLSKVIEAPADDVWAVLRVLDDVDKYSDTIARVVWTGPKGEGGERVCYTPDGNGYFKEKILSFDDTKRSFTYSLIEGAPVHGMVNAFKVVDLGYQKSMIVWTSNYDAFVKNPNMTEEQFLGWINIEATTFMANIGQAAVARAQS